MKKIYKGLNRTIVELKPGLKAPLTVLNSSLNRTIVELKQIIMRPEL